MNGFSDSILIINILLYFRFLLFYLVIADHGVNLSNGTIGIEYILEIH